MPVILRIFINILQQCSYRTSMRGNQNCFVFQRRIMDLLFPEIMGSVHYILNILSVLWSWRYFKGSLKNRSNSGVPSSMAPPDLIIFHFQNSKIDFLDSGIRDHRNLTVTDNLFRCLSCPDQRTCETDIKGDIL